MSLRYQFLANSIFVIINGKYNEFCFDFSAPKPYNGWDVIKKDVEFELNR
jgi:hypothetical protein